MTDYDLVLQTYGRLRSATKDLHTEIIQGVLTKDTIQRAARDLGMLHKGTLVFETEDESCVLFDHAIYDGLEDGANSVDRYAATRSFPLGSEEEAALAAMRQAYFSLFHVVETVDGAGVWVEDTLRETRHFLADVGLSVTGLPGLLLATRVFPCDGFLMTCGAARPVGRKAADEITSILAQWDCTPESIAGQTREEAARLAGEIIAACVRAGGAERIAYLDPGKGKYESDVTEPIVAGTRVGRNEPCPCGSGRKYKKCCGGNSSPAA